MQLSPRYSFSREQVLGVFNQMCLAVDHMHSQKPPIIHRDLKVENFLLAKGGIIKLCDFGSATTTTYEPDYSWTAIQVRKLHPMGQRFYFVFDFLLLFPYLPHLFNDLEFIMVK